MIAHGFDDRVDAAVPNAEPLAGHAADVRFTARCAVERHVSSDDVFLRHERGAFGRVKDDLAAAQALAEVIIGVAFQFQRHAARHECSKALPCAAGELDVDCVVGQTVWPPLPGEFAAGDGADDAVHVAEGQFGANLLAAFDGGLAEVEQRSDVE